VEFDEEKKVPSMFRLNIQLPSVFPEKYKEAVINAAELCLVKKTINNLPEFQIITTQNN
jgi:ribosomal protein S12 methylthiotransferase accessory factor